MLKCKYINLYPTCQTNVKVKKKCGSIDRIWKCCVYWFGIDHQSHKCARFENQSNFRIPGSGVFKAVPTPRAHLWSIGDRRNTRQWARPIKSTLSHFSHNPSLMKSRTSRKLSLLPSSAILLSVFTVCIWNQSTESTYHGRLRLWGYRLNIDDIVCQQCRYTVLWVKRACVEVGVHCVAEDIYWLKIKLAVLVTFKYYALKEWADLAFSIVWNFWSADFAASIRSIDYITRERKVATRGAFCVISGRKFFVVFLGRFRSIQTAWDWFRNGHIGVRFHRFLVKQTEPRLFRFSSLVFDFAAETFRNSFTASYSGPDGDRVHWFRCGCDCFVGIFCRRWRWCDSWWQFDLNAIATLLRCGVGVSLVIDFRVHFVAFVGFVVIIVRIFVLVDFGSHCVRWRWNTVSCWKNNGTASNVMHITIWDLLNALTVSSADIINVRDVGCRGVLCVSIRSRIFADFIE